MNVKRVERIWRREGLKVPQRQPKRGRLWFNDGSCVRLRPQYPGHVWSYDFVMDRTHDGKAFRMLTVIDEHSRQCLAIHVQRKLRSDDVLAVLSELFQRHGPPDHIRSDNGAEFTAHAVRDWLGRIGVKTLYIEPGSPWEDGYNERLAFGLLRVQRQTQGRATQWGDLLHTQGSGHPDRTLAPALQHHPTALIAGLPAARTTNDRASPC